MTQGRCLQLHAEVTAALQETESALRELDPEHETWSVPLLLSRSCSAPAS